jgi:hypothetical protein
MTTYYERIAYIAIKCLENKIPFEIRQLYDGWQIRFAWASNADAAAHEGTFGSSDGLVETYHFPWDEDDVSVLTPEEVFNKILELYTYENAFLPRWQA